MPRILIIDDDPDIVEAMKIVLESERYDIDIATSGGEGLKKVKSTNPELIILDIMMETSDKGFEVARAIKEDKRYSNIPILMLTAIKEKTGLDFKKEAGDRYWLPVDDYCDKPLSPEDLLKKVKRLLREK